MIYNDNSIKQWVFFPNRKLQFEVELILYYLFIYIIHINWVYCVIIYFLCYEVYAILWRASRVYVTALLVAIKTATRSICLQIWNHHYILSHFVLVKDVTRSSGLRGLSRLAIIFGGDLEAKNEGQSLQQINVSAS